MEVVLITDKKTFDKVSSPCDFRCLRKHQKFYVVLVH